MGKILVVLLAIVGVEQVALGQSAPTCSLDTGTGTLTVTMNGLTDTVTVAAGKIKIVSTAVICSTTTNTDTIVVNGNGQLTFRGNFEPGKTAEATGASEIEFQINNNIITFDFSTGDDLVNVVTTGADVNADGDQDITLNGTQAKITYKGGDGNDVIDGTAYAGALILNLWGGNGTDHLIGSNGIDYVWGDADDDVIETGNANDKLWGGKGDDTLVGGAGNDQYMEDKTANGSDFMDGGAGVDKVNYALRTGAISVTLADGLANEGEAGEADELLGVENVTTGSGDDTIVGDTLANTLHGGNGNDDIYGGGGADKLYGDANDDYIQGDAGNDSHYGGTGNDILVGDLVGVDKFFGDAGDDTIVDNADGKAETIDCGVGLNDAAETAAEDTFLGCEVLNPP